MWIVFKIKGSKIWFAMAIVDYIILKRIYICNWFGKYLLNDGWAFLDNFLEENVFKVYIFSALSVIYVKN